jgi:hypothetical protein
VWNIDGQASYSVADRERSSLGKGYFNGVLANALNVNIRGDGIGKGSSIGPETYTITRANGTLLDPYDANNYTSAPRMRSMPCTKRTSRPAV